MLRPLSPIAHAAPGIRVLSYGTATAVPIALSNDRLTVYGSTQGQDSKLYQSVDDGVTWTLVTTLTPTTETVLDLMETDDGEALLITQSSGATPGNVWKSSGWSTSHTTATWTKKLQSIGGRFDGSWSATQWSFGDDAVVPGSGKHGIVAEYGPQTSVTYASGNSDTTDLTKARRAYITHDYGATWTQVLDLAARFPNATTLHCHAGVYDPYWDRYWVTFGDTLTNTIPATQTLLVLYSDDAGATWTPVPVSGSVNNGWQSTSMAVTPDAIILGSDMSPGLIRVPRTGYRQLGTPQTLYTLQGGTGTGVITNRIHRNKKQTGAPFIIGITSSNADVPVASFVSLDGAMWTELWRDPNLVAGNSSQAVITLVGPTASGKVVGDVLQTTGTHWQLRGDLINPGGNLHVRKPITFTGDGTTAVFNIPHGLGVIPRQFMAWDERATAGTYTVTADATNIIVTCGAAPANTAKLQFGYRFAA